VPIHPCPSTRAHQPVPINPKLVLGPQAVLTPGAFPSCADGVGCHREGTLLVTCSLLGLVPGADLPGLYRLTDVFAGSA
jgi:hypothetical protein